MTDAFGQIGHGFQNVYDLLPIVGHRELPANSPESKPMREAVLSFRVVHEQSTIQRSIPPTLGTCIRELVEFLNRYEPRCVRVEGFYDGLQVHQVQLFNRPYVGLAEVMSRGLDTVLQVVKLLEVVIVNREDKMASFDDPAPALWRGSVLISSLAYVRQTGRETVPYPSIIRTCPEWEMRTSIGHGRISRHTGSMIRS